MKPLFLLGAAALFLSACQIPSPRMSEHVTQWDFGPLVAPQNNGGENSLLQDNQPYKNFNFAPIQNIGNQKNLFHSTVMEYRLLHENPHVVHQYALNRWADNPAKLIEKRLMDNLAAHGLYSPPSFLAHSSPSAKKNIVPTLKIAIQHFDWHYLDAHTARATISLSASLDNPATFKTFSASRTHSTSNALTPPSAADAAAALAHSTDALSQELAAWLTPLLASSAQQ